VSEIEALRIVAEISRQLLARYPFMDDDEAKTLWCNLTMAQAEWDRAKGMR